MQRSAIYGASAVAGAIAQSATQAVARLNQPRGGISVPAVALKFGARGRQLARRATSKAVLARKWRPAIFSCLGHKNADQHKCG